MPTPTNHPDEPEQPLQSQPDPPAAGSGDQDIDTAGTEADTMTALGPSARKRHPAPGSLADAPGNEGKAIGPHDPATMHRAEDDVEHLAESPDFHDRPGSGARRPR